jgi:GT2 family glycosyltransferase
MYDLSICIVNHRTPELTRNCLQSIVDTKGDLALEAFLVNNTVDACSIDGINLPVIFIQNKKPLGFAANQNQMLQRSASRYVLPLNSDTIIHPNALQALIQFMDTHPRCGIAGPRLEYADGRLQHSCLTFPTFISQLLEASGRWQHFKGNRLVARYQKLCDPHDQDMPVDWLYGACLITRREVLDQAGMYDDELFEDMYGEDVEWMWRIHKAGWEVWFTPSATVTHLENQSPLSNRAFALYRGARKFYRKHYSRRQQWGVRMGIVLGLLPKRFLLHDATRRRQVGQIINACLFYWDDDTAW